MPHVLLRAATLVVLGFAAPAHACLFSESPSQKLARAYQANIFSAVAIARIDKAEPAVAGAGPTLPQRYTATIHTVLSGVAKDKTVEFVFPSTCDSGIPLPAVGDAWVVYLWTHPDGRQLVWASYPADVAFSADSRLPRR